METLKKKQNNNVKDAKGKTNEVRNDVKSKVDIQKKKDDKINERVDGKVIDFKTKTDELKGNIEHKANEKIWR